MSHELLIYFILIGIVILLCQVDRLQKQIAAVHRNLKMQIMTPEESKVELDAISVEAKRNDRHNLTVY